MEKLSHRNILCCYPQTAQIWRKYCYRRNTLNTKQKTKKSNRIKKTLFTMARSKPPDHWTYSLWTSNKKNTCGDRGIFTSSCAHWTKPRTNQADNNKQRNGLCRRNNPIWTRIFVYCTWRPLHKRRSFCFFIQTPLVHQLSFNRKQQEINRNCRSDSSGSESNKWKQWLKESNPSDNAVWNSTFTRNWNVRSEEETIDWM